MDDLAQSPGSPTCACRVCLDTRIAEIERDIERMAGVSVSTHAVVVRPMLIRLAELREFRVRLARGAPGVAG